MGIDKSLVSKNKLVRERNVLTRAERVGILKGEGNWNEDKSVFGLRKVKIQRLKRKPTKEASKEAPKAVPKAEASAEKKVTKVSKEKKAEKK